MARSSPVIAYLKPSDRLKLRAVSILRKTSMSLAMIELVRDAFGAAFGPTADPRKILDRYEPMFGNEEVVTQRAKRKRRLD